MAQIRDWQVVLFLCRLIGRRTSKFQHVTLCLLCGNELPKQFLAFSCKFNEPSLVLIIFAHSSLFQYTPCSPCNWCVIRQLKDIFFAFPLPRTFLRDSWVHWLLLQWPCWIDYRRFRLWAHRRRRCWRRVIWNNYYGWHRHDQIVVCSAIAFLVRLVDLIPGGWHLLLYLRWRGQICDFYSILYCDQKPLWFLDFWIRLCLFRARHRVASLDSWTALHRKVVQVVHVEVEYFAIDRRWLLFRFIEYLVLHIL